MNGLSGRWPDGLPESGFFAGVDQPAARPRDAIGQDEHHDLPKGDAHQKAAQNVVKRDIGKKRHRKDPNTGVGSPCQAIGAEP